MDVPLVIVNLKTYEEGSREAARDLAYTCEKVADLTDACIAVAVQNADLYRITSRIDIPVLAQHIDPVTYGSNTGKDLAGTLAYNGADGVIINHSEDQLPLDAIKDAVEQARAAGLDTIVCVDVPEMAEKVSNFDPDFIAIEPPKLIGGDVSVSSAAPELVEEAVHRASPTVLCGAGIKDREDVANAMALGTDGVLIASGIVKARDPAAALQDIVGGL